MSMEQKCGTNHPILQQRLKQLFKCMRKTKLTQGIVLIASLTFSANALAESRATTAVVSPNLTELRDQFEDAERRVKRANEAEYLQLQKKFSGYPLWPYLEVEFLKNHLSLDNEAYVLNFMQTYYGSPMERQLRDAWLNFLARRNDAQRFTRDFVNRGNTQQVCRYLGYRLRLDPSEQELEQEIWPQVQARWVQANSQPRICDSVFTQWTRAGERTQDVVWQRFDAALDEGVWNIARFARSLLSDEQEAGATQLANQLIALRQRPQRVSDWAQLPYQNPRVRHHLYRALQQLSWRDIDALVRVWPRMRDEVEFTTAQKQVIDSQIGVVLAVRNEPSARAWFESVDTTALGPAGQQWYLATLLRDRDFHTLLEFSEHMTEGSQPAYWRARALTELERHVEAEAEWTELAKLRHFYGFMAAAHLDQAPNLSRERAEATPEATQALLSRAEVQRAHEFFQLGRHFDARREWNLVRSRVSEDERVAAAILSYEWGWLDQSIREFAALGLTQDLDRRFPVGFREVLEREAESNQIDPSWALAIIRRESAFQVDAVSPVGARGLMQIMPDTATYLQQSTHVGRQMRRAPDMNNPEENIQYGTRYLSELLRRNGGNWLLATASYNAGFHRVREWVPNESVPVDIWIETIPYQETRDYVKAVLTYQQIYLSLLGRDDNLLQHMHSMRMDPEGGLCEYANIQVESATRLAPITTC